MSDERKEREEEKEGREIGGEKEIYMGGRGIRVV